MAELNNNEKMVADLLEVQKELPKVSKSGTGNYGKYMRLDELMPETLKVLNKHNFVLIQSPSTIDGQPALTTQLLHTTGVQITDSMLLMLDRQTAQGQGSSITYARRYALCSMLGIVADEDDDGQRSTDESNSTASVKVGPQARPRDPNAPLSAAQVGLVFARLKSKGISTKDEANNSIYLLTGKDKISEVTMGEMDELLNGIDAMQEVPAES